MGICLIIKWMAIQMQGNMVVWSSEHHLVNRPVFRPFEYRSAIQMPGTMVSGIWIVNHLNNKQVIINYSVVCYSDPHCISFKDCWPLLAKNVNLPICKRHKWRCRPVPPEPRCSSGRRWSCPNFASPTLPKFAPSPTLRWLSYLKQVQIFEFENMDKYYFKHE